MMSGSGDVGSHDDHQENPNVLGQSAPNQDNAVNMQTIVDYLKDHQRQIYSKEAEWLFEKQNMQNTINQLDGQLQAQEAINRDLMQRVKMLEFSLR